MFEDISDNVLFIKSRLFDYAILFKRRDDLYIGKTENFYIVAKIEYYPVCLKDWFRKYESKDWLYDKFYMESLIKKEFK